jgi:signal recognition particle subunit SRP54
MSGFIKTIQEAGIDKQPELYKRLTKGQFSMRDMYTQFQNLNKIGPLGKVMSMIPGFSQELMPEGKEKEGAARIKKLMVMMNSFTNEELDEEDLLKMKNLDSRIKRVAKGSGRSVNEVNDLLQQFKKFQIMVKNMGEMNLDKGNYFNLK